MWRATPIGLARLARPANIITAYSDILAGYAAATAAIPAALPYLLVATTGLYGGGVVFNDVCDADLDATERPERPIPSGIVSLGAATAFGAVFLIAAVVIARQWSPLSGLLAAGTAVAALLYDRVGKHHAALGPLNMGLCRALNLLLGVTAGGRITGLHWLLAAVPLCYIAGITSLSRGEVKGGTRVAAILSGCWLVAGFVLFLALVVSQGVHAAWCLPFAVALLLRIAGPLGRAFRSLTPEAIRHAIKTGVLSLILLNASLAAVFAGPWYAVGVLLLYVPAMLLARLFAVT
ncbi:MAG TPA: UbiA-like protein EboC [Bryobacteraceae bacterium]